MLMHTLKQKACLLHFYYSKPLLVFVTRMEKVLWYTIVNSYTVVYYTPG